MAELGSCRSVALFLCVLRPLTPKSFRLVIFAKEGVQEGPADHGGVMKCGFSRCNVVALFLVTVWGWRQSEIRMEFEKSVFEK